MLASELFNKVQDYLDGTISLEDFEGWLVPRLSLLFASPFPSTQELVGTAELGLAEMSSGTRSEDEFKVLLRTKLRGLNAFWYSFSDQDQIMMATLASNENLRVSTQEEPVFTWTPAGV